MSRYTDAAVILSTVFARKLRLLSTSGWFWFKLNIAKLLRSGTVCGNPLGIVLAIYDGLKLCKWL